jgi:trigger factor
MSQTDDFPDTNDSTATAPTESFKGLKATLKEGQAWTRFLEIEVPIEEVDALFDLTYEEYRKKAWIAGFRPGKAPMGMVKQRYAQDVKGDVFEVIVPKAYEQALIEQNLVPLNPPKLSDVDFDEGKPLKFKAEFEIRPEVKLSKYTGFSVEKTIPTIGDKEIDDSLQYLRERLAEYHPVTRASENGDMLIVDLLKKHSKLGKLKEEKLENVEIELGSKGLLEEFQRGLVGIRIGEMKDISVKYPADYYDADLAGDQVLYLTVVKEIKKKVLPDLNDEFAAKVSNSKTVVELREKAKENLEKQAQDDATRNLRNEIIKRVVEANTFDVPISLLENYLQNVIEDYKKRNERVDEEAIRSQFRGLGENLIRWSYLQYEIAKAESIKVDADDRRKWVENFAKTYNMTVEAARESLGKAKRLQDIDESILEEKVLQFIIDKSEIVTNK